jgi:hypothetical protein
MYIYARKRPSVCGINPFWIDLARLHQNFIAFSCFLRDFWRSRSLNFRSGTESVNDVVAASTHVFVARFPGPGYLTTATGSGCGSGGGNYLHTLRAWFLKQLQRIDNARTPQSVLDRHSFVKPAQVAVCRTIQNFPQKCRA